MSAPRVRFAPSPTGYLHVGGARTAIFNWLFARKHGGAFVLRIEDTDRERSTEEAVRAILEGMAWLGLEADEGPFFQSHESERHEGDAARLVGSGAAYRCFCDPATLKRQREEAERSKGQYAYPRTCRDVPAEEAAARAEAGEPFAVRFRVPDGAVEWDDEVHGPTRIDASELEDFVILRRDGTPTYMLSVVSDDAHMGITHVIRGDDHLSNAPKQILLYRALGRPVPRFAHLPLILGEDKKRLSKRHGAVSVLAYRDQGYLPEAMFNFLALLGWNPGDDRERMSRDELVEAFDLARAGRSGAVFDLRKLEWLNGQYLTDLPAEDVAGEARRDLEAIGLWSDDYEGAEREWFLEVLALLKSRARTVREIVPSGRYFFDPSDRLEYDAKAVKKHLKGDTLADDLRALREVLAGADKWSPAALESAVRALAEARGLSAGKLIHPARLAVTGRKDSPGMFEVLALVGKQRAIARLDRLVEFIEARKRATGETSGTPGVS